MTSMTDKLTSRIPGIDRGDRTDVVAVVKLHGVITPTPSPLARGSINLAAVESALTRAFDHDRLKAVALLINSPGGAPTQSGLVAERIRQLAAKKKDVPVLAFCEDVAASGGYWLACAADEIYAHRTSLVGSIGVISGGFGFAGLLDRFGIERRLHTAGENKSRLDPFSPEKPEDVEWLEKMHAQLHELFVSWVKERRGDKLSPTEDLFTGDVWLGEKAKELGLIDGVGNLRELIAQRFPAAEIKMAEPKKPLLARLGVGAPAAAILDAVTQKAMWSRYGL
ncbi:S49 family peptidase [Amycolatopsis acidiphila]|uniref:S49 family peptidase n=1 Tax=Amycolatopsis acidiphila TaxID=715473 RepID=A0A558AFV2_9PSEU|nr:S49 family peptidase [Amycolatopsis acidiphila]TVT23096.1 S49 family peptidase [Amycolatopsis acidiphila]UIJ60219.1 S49 family peptidase [Amycolatopsis acidiphila]GHG60701.1 serine protease [Amycolatopsis acidiphila]